ncbi:MAG: homocysteine S-methyltransferase family protein [Bacteroidales bacterium]
MGRKNRIQEIISQGRIPVGDGAWGTLLQAKGLAAGECPELWNLTHPSEVLSIAQAYVEAGADIIETNSFGGSPVKLAHYKLHDRASEINEAAARLSRDAAGDKVIVLGSMGPTGKLILTGDITAAEMYEAYALQAAALERGGADALIAETMSDLEEALIAIRAIRENTSCEIVCSFTFEKMISGEYRSMMGYSPMDVAQELINGGATILGANCGNGIGGMIDIVKSFRSVSPEVPILIQANAGLPVIREGKTVFPESPLEMAAAVPELIRAGASAIGGCCGTGPEHIRQLVRTIRK